MDEDAYQDDRQFEDQTCKRCGQEDLFFRLVGDTWKLFEHRPYGAQAEHKCKTSSLDFSSHFD